MPIIKDFTKKAAQKILGKIVPRNYEVGEPTGPGAEETLKRQMPQSGQKKPAKPTSKGDEVRPEEPPKAPEQPGIEEPIQQRPSGQAPSVKHEEPVRGEKGTPAGESSAPEKPTPGGGGKTPEGASTGKLTGFPSEAEGGAERINQYLEGIENLSKSAWYEKFNPNVVKYIVDLIKKTKLIAGTSIFIAGGAIALLLTLSLLADALGIKSDALAPAVNGVPQGSSGLFSSKVIRQCMFATRNGQYVTVTGQPLSQAQKESRCAPGFGKSYPTFINNDYIGVCSDADCDYQETVSCGKTTSDGIKHGC